jgi:hypothetical protein
MALKLQEAVRRFSTMIDTKEYDGRSNVRVAVEAIKNQHSMVQIPSEYGFTP